MTNYNERLGELLTELRSGTINFDDKAKQAITSLIKELVTEAKPMTTSVNVIETYLQNGMPQKAAEHHGRNHAIDQYEQNLLKALEEN